MTAINLAYNLLRPVAFRGKYRLANLLVPTAGLRSAKVFGYHMQLDLADYIQRSIYAGVWEVEETAQVRAILHPGMTFVDVGANVGYYTALASMLVGEQGKVVAFEPEPNVFGRLERLIKSNGINQALCQNIGLSNCSTTIPLYVPPASYGNQNASTSCYCDDMKAIEIRTTTLDTALTSARIDRVDLLKIDVEGYELKVLDGASLSLQDGRIANILCEFNEPMLKLGGTTPRELYEFLMAMGFRIRSGRPPDLNIRSQNLFFSRVSGRA